MICRLICSTKKTIKMSLARTIIMNILPASRSGSAPIMLILISTWISSQPEMVMAGQCESIQIEMCQSIQWNMTSMPNLLLHSTHGNARLSITSWKELIDTGCSDDLLFFLCAMHAPICTPHFSEPVPPCKSVCQRAKSACEPIMNNYNVSWPIDLDCSVLPEYNRGVCLSPDAIVTTLPKEGKLTFRCITVIVFNQSAAGNISNLFTKL